MLDKVGQTGPLTPVMEQVGDGFTVTEPLTLLEQPVALLRTVNVNGIDVPPAPELKFTIIGEAPNVPLVTGVIPVPDILY